jgi:hypothetical protein
MEWKVLCETEERVCLGLSCQRLARRRERQEEEEFGCGLGEIDEIDLLAAWWY